MSIVRTFYKKFCGNLFDEQILSVKAFLAQAAIQVLFHRYKEVKPSIKCLPNEHKKEETILTKTSGLLYSDLECMVPNVGMPFYLNQNTKNSKRTSCIGKLSPETAKLVQNTFNYVGSTNPAGHGVLRLILEPEVDMMKSPYPDINLLHGGRGTEKLMEHKNFFLTLPYFDRFDDYTSCIENCNSLGVKQLPNTETAPRVLTQFLHSGCGISPGYELCDIVSGDQLLIANICPDRGSLDILIGLRGEIYALCGKYPVILDELKGNRTPNRIFLARAIGMGSVLGHDDLNLGFLEAVHSPTDIKWKLSKTQPYNTYDKIEYDIATVITGDFYDHYLFRVEEMHQPSHIIAHCLIKMPTKGKKVDDDQIYSSKPSREDLSHHFKYFNSEFIISPEHTYTSIEIPKVEFGVYHISNGTTHPYRCKILAPCVPR